MLREHRHFCIADCWPLPGHPGSFCGHGIRRVLSLPREQGHQAAGCGASLGWPAGGVPFSPVGYPTNLFSGGSSPPQGLEAERRLPQLYFIWRKFWISNSLLLCACVKCLPLWPGCVRFLRDLWIPGRLAAPRGFGNPEERAPGRPPQTLGLAPEVRLEPGGSN